jgi:adenylate kinase
MSSAEPAPIEKVAVEKAIKPGLDKRYRAVLLMGAPGTGKGTQGNIIKNIPGFYHFAIGDAFRRIDTHSELGKVFYDHSSRGELVPDDVTIKLWASNLNAHAILGDYKPHRELLVLDGIPRTVAQAKMLEEYVNVLRIIHLQTSDMDAMIDRLRKRAIKENRIDDANEATIRRRFQVYETETKAVLNCYPPDRVSHVVSEGSPARVLYDILAVLAPLQDQIYSGTIS